MTLKINRIYHRCFQWIGEACANYFAKAGANLLLCARRPDALKPIAEQPQRKWD